MVSEFGRSAGELNHMSEYKIDMPSCQIVTKKEPVSPRKRRYNKFLRGPIPLVWLSQAAKCSGKTFQLGIALWYLVGLTNCFTVKLTRSTINLFGLSRWSVSRNLNLLKSAGLVTLEPRKGKAPLVTIVDEPRSTVETDGEDWGDTYV